GSSFLFTPPPPRPLYSLSLHDALPIYVTLPSKVVNGQFAGGVYRSVDGGNSWESAMGPGINTALGKKDEYGEGEIAEYGWLGVGDRKSTRLNSSHQIISYAVFCLKKKK